MKMVRGRGVMPLMLALTLGAAALPAQAGLFDSLFAKKEDPSSATQREWQLDQFTRVRLAAKESGSPANQHPAALDPSALRKQLAAVQTTVIRESTEPLFDADELSQLVPVLVRAFSLAGPDDDVLLLSTSRRSNQFSVPQGLTARLFVQGDSLNLIVHDARLDFIVQYRNSGAEPRFVYGSRTQRGSVSLRSASARPLRSDWLAIPLGALNASAVAAVQAPAPAAPAAAVVPAAGVSSSQPPAPGSPAAVGEEVEQRLIVLKRLRDKGLISEDEYQQKRREALQKL